MEKEAGNKTVDGKPVLPPSETLFFALFKL